MKNPIFKSALILASALALLNCSEDAVEGVTPPSFGDSNLPGDNPTPGPEDNVASAKDPCWQLNDILIYPAGIVTDFNGNVIGTFDSASQTVTTIDGVILYQNVNTNTLTVTTREEASAVIPASSSAIVGILSSSSQVVTPITPIPGDTAVVIPGNTEQSSSSVVVKPESSSSAPPATDGSVTIAGNLNQTVAKNAMTSEIKFTGVKDGSVQRTWNLYFLNGELKDGVYTIHAGQVPDHLSGTVKDDFTINGKTYTVSITISGSNPQVSSSSVKSSSSSVKSSSSSVKSSSSSVRSSSSSVKSSSSSQQQGGASLLPKVIPGAQTKTGYATRYWDSCKPHCAWEGKGGPVARTCRTDGVTTAGSGESSVCNGGNAGTCFDQTPQIVNDTIAYAFAASPGGGNDCGKCYMLTFKGTGASATNTPTDSHHRAIKGKHLIIMSSNIGYDVNHNQFDLMIPGGGPGEFNGCGKMNISCAGAQYGGFLKTCNYKKDCLIQMCNSEYANNKSLRDGCLFLANWMDAANNPEIDFIEVECPRALVEKY